ncbi:hypothetical protein [Neorhizobium galegae]|uniref:Transmembrane protein n=1 Tax=Neorhizobium galegae bv. orientalis str. HAMBI 540 TaxID=1028800 RepID=A0A068SM44_NEOGA|nr:hypothetical protein [Neorhizobium galegae]MCQ1856049.1 hypothetical protein [Neorhizobium galegae]CDN46821.1 Hypothetical protein RG540_CH06310 [Neorhizobium galegae bv. orientalis str. HAMBI 540]
MLDQFQMAAASIYSGWVLFGCLVFAFGIFPALTMKLWEKRKHGLVRIACIVAALTSFYVLLQGARMAIDWVDPFAGKESQMAGAIHNPKGWIIVAVIVVWPYLLMIIGALIGHLAIRDLLRLRRVA